MNAGTAPRPYPTVTDRCLVAVYLIGVYLGISASLPGGVPIPAVMAGAAGLLLLARHSAEITMPQTIGLAMILTVAVLSILSAPDLDLTRERFKGLVQFFYSIVIGFVFYLAARRFTAHAFARWCLVLSTMVLAIAALETLVPQFRTFSDAFRSWAFDFGVYTADIRDQMLYGQVRPKGLTSEPSYASFGFLLFSFAWYVLSPARLKTLLYGGYLGIGYLILNAPTILLGAPLMGIYIVTLGARYGPLGHRRLDIVRVFGGILFGTLLAAVAIFVGFEVLDQRIAQIAEGRDPSFFARMIAPPLVALRVIVEHPIAGAGLAGWEYISNIVNQLYQTSRFLTLDYRFESAAHAITNYFWLHWIFLGLLFGILMIAALTWHLRAIGVQSIAFCWGVWVVFGQGAGGYVDPRTWTVFIMAALISVLHERASAPVNAPAPAAWFDRIPRPARPVDRSFNPG